ncbi:MAG: histidine phosphatase family protein [Clostridia bacterium]|nr:histidine phosphatase family protein [Clostridia bacterium]
MSVVLIRHGLTQGNLEHRYIGCRTDETLCEEGKAALKEQSYPPVCRVLASPMTRCVQTARLLYPEITPEIVPDFRECDFGRFEGKSYEELNGDPDYQAWIDSGGVLPFPGGESREAFIARCVHAFERIPDLWEGDTALIAHGGTLMAIMQSYALPKRDYFDYQIKNGQGFRLFADGAWEKLYF